MKKIFYQELENQSHFALWAAKDLGEVLSKMNSGDFVLNMQFAWYSIESFINSVGNISRILWPSKQYEQRGKEIRGVLGITDSSLLKPRDMRNNFAHFDERIESFISSNPSGVMDRNIGPLNMFGRENSNGYFRHYDTENKVIIFRGEQYNLIKVCDELIELNNNVKHFLQE